MAQQELPRSFVRNFNESNPGYRRGLNEETDALFNPSIEAKPLHLPMAGQIKKRLNSDVEFFWAFDRCGASPNHERVERLRNVGFDYATTNDVQMALDEVVKGRNDKNFSNEIRNGDLRLMKVAKRRWLEIRKSHLLQAIMMTNPKGKMMGEDGTVMGVNTSLPGVRTTNAELDGGNFEDIRAKAVISNAKQDLADGEIRGNASVVSKESVSKGR